MMRRLPLLLSLAAVPVSAAPAPDFTFEVKPLLSDRCFRCHGMDAAGRKADLRLDTRDGLFGKSGDTGRAIVQPGRRAESELWARIVSTDPDELMPPPESHQVLTPAEIGLIGAWIDAGAPWTPHWSFVPPAERIEVPRPARADWARNEIDRFVLARLEKNGLSPAPEAPRETWLRRATLDLTGLPPAPEEIAAFLADTAPGAHERVVDRLLAGDAYAEHQAVRWLDIARYGDTFGYQSDADNRVWPWRDWVISAFRRNLPYDRFITWQLAGDLLPNPTREQRVATAFNRLHRMTNEGGSIDEEFRIEYVVDRVSTFGTAFLGLSLECARCHDHKYDPISQADFFRLSAFFNNIDESGLYSHFTRAVPAPSLPLHQDDAQEQRHAGLLAAVRDAEKRWTDELASAAGRAAAWLATARNAGLVPEPVAHFPFDGDKPGANLRQPEAGARLHDNPARVAGRFGEALAFSGDNNAHFPGVGVFDRSQPFSLSLWLRQPAGTAGRQVVLHRSRAYSDSGSRGYELVLEDGHLTWSLIHFWPGEAIRVKSKAPLPAGSWHQVTVTYDGSSRAAGLGVHVDGQAVDTAVVRDHLTLDIQHRSEWGDSDVGGVHLTLAERFRDSGFKDGQVDDLKVFDRALTRAEIALNFDAALPVSAGALAELYAHRFDEAVRAAAEELRKARREEDAFITRVPRLMVMHEQPVPRPTFILNRGAYDAPGQAVTAGTPDALLPFPSGAPLNRLGLAQWLTHPRQPLTARVSVNRAWAMFFGSGLVETEEDFGVQGRMPADPRLLDWLTRNFQESGWNWSGLLRSIVLSATYRQASQATAEALARDPRNALLARGPRHRLSAEQIRDSALAASGLLVRTVGGPSVLPYQPERLWEDSGINKTYHQGKGADLYRRSMYTFWRRIMPPPSMSTFDAPSREFCKVRREVTQTPLQALVLLNDPQFLEASRVLAAGLLESGATEEGLVRGACERLLGRLPHEREVAAFSALRERQRQWFSTRPEEARAFLAIGASPRGRDLPPAELASATVVVSAIMNLDEFTVKR